MSVYIDDAKIYYRGMLMCHMFADTEEDLHAMAAAVGLRRSWYQKGSVLAHYDICLTKRAKALKLGALQVDRYFLVERIRQVREANTATHDRAGSTISTLPGTSAPQKIA